MAEAKSDSSNGPSFRGLNSGQQDGSLSSNPFAKSKLGSSLLRPPQLKPVLGTLSTGNNSNINAKDDSETMAAVEAPKFVPLGAPEPPTSLSGTSSAPAPSITTTATVATFVFGQNLSERVTAPVERISLFSTSTPSASVDHANTNGNSDNMLFSTALHQPSETTQASEGLAAAAAEYEAKHARAPPPTSASPPLTGEEGERNVLQVSCRLFAFEGGAWRERGRGVLRLNDTASGGGSRLVLRAAGSLRVLINTKVWPEMVVERAGAKSLRLTATDAQARVNVFLIMASPDDIGHLFRALSQRVNLLKKAAPPSSSAPTALFSSGRQLPREDMDSDADDNADRLDHSDSSFRESEESAEKVDDESVSGRPSEKDATDSGQDSEDCTRGIKRKDETSDADGSPKRRCAE